MTRQEGSSNYEQPSQGCSYAKDRTPLRQAKECDLFGREQSAGIEAGMDNKRLGLKGFVEAGVMLIILNA